MGLGLIVVEVCESNAMAALPLEDLEEEFPEVAIMRTDCLNMCALCKAKSYVMVDNQRVASSDRDICLAKTKEAIKQHLDQFYGAVEE
ncbi:DUF1450 domain-containing protein [Paenibacillus guangzhouensis]|uniref:DUF1450 domain-containing protein n=1 Tax=Paenibacillus guangzhouensis TaxID=1473112 RepID=UPI0012675AD5|nr:DUF1450 domain-containing protein [Paenibacillus guangzhouensis]